jgi:hypothetical protein
MPDKDFFKGRAATCAVTNTEEQHMDVGKLEHARSVLERNLHWIAIVETKTAVILSIDIALLSALAVAFSDSTDKHTTWCLVPPYLLRFP